MNAWEVMRINRNGNHVEIDTVFYDETCDAEYVFKACTEHDGMPASYVQREISTKGCMVQYEAYPIIEDTF